MTMNAREDRLAALAVLAEPLRRRFYLHVASSTEPMSRETAAEALGVSRSVAAFHLDKLAEAGVLDVEYRRPPGKGGPGAGRPTKFYRRPERELDFSVPERRYDLAAAILAQAVSDARERAIPVDEALRLAARDFGRVIGAGLDDADAASENELERVLAILTAHGYEPERRGEVITLQNCPFHVLAEEHRELVCGMNLNVLEGLLEGAAAPDLTARLDPAPGRCCVNVYAGAGAGAGAGAKEPGWPPAG
jgi:predicted ArsR family transcriptional regulator